MTKNSISETAALRALLSETSDTQLLAEMLGFVADRLMALDVDQLCGAGTYKRSTDRVNHRNGYRTRGWETRAGRVDLKIPKQHLGSYFPEFLEPRRAVKNAMTAVIEEAYVQPCNCGQAKAEEQCRTNPQETILSFKLRLANVRSRSIVGKRDRHRSD